MLIAGNVPRRVRVEGTYGRVAAVEGVACQQGYGKPNDLRSLRLLGVSVGNPFAISLP